MRQLFTYLTICLACTITSCTSDDTLLSEPTNVKEGYIVLKERNPNLPKVARTFPIITEDNLTLNSRASNESGAIIGNSDKLLGYSYFAGNTILGDYNNVGRKIVDLDKVKSYSTDYVTPKELKQFSSERFSYSNYDTYESKLTQTKKVTTGFSINLGIFKIGRKKTTESTFKSEITTSNRAVYGELSMVYNHSSFNLDIAEGSRKLYARECLSPSFRKNLYSSTIGNIINSYGEFVLTGYITGGKAFALFAGLGATGSSAESRENGLNKDIDASFTWKDKSASGESKFGKGNSSSSSSSYNTSSLHTKLWMLGGQPIGLSMNSANELTNISFNLEPWVQSLSNQNNHTIVDLTENGAFPLSAFVLEENFKRRFDDTTLGILPSYPTFVTPFIEITRVFERYGSNGEALYDIAAVLNTRQGDQIVLRKASSSPTDAELRSNESSTVFTQKANSIKQEKQAFFDLEIGANSVKRLNPQMGKPLCIDLRQVDESSMAVYTNPRTGVQYIYDKAKRIAFSHIIDDIDEDWILDEYGIRDWVESLPKKSISMATLASYTIIGL